MKTIFVNGNERGVDSQATPFDQMINGLNTELSQELQVISCIKIDGHEIDESEHKKLAQTPIEALGTIEITTSNPSDLAQETLNTLDVYLDRIIQNIESTAQNYTSKNLLTADGYFVRSVDGLDLFVQTIGGIKMALRVGLQPKIALTEATLVSIMNDLLDAKRQNNYVLLGELLEKDLIENLKEWKTVVFPLLRNWKVA